MYNIMKNNAFVLLMFLLFGGVVSACLQYELIWDFINYHYFNVWAFLNNRVGEDVLLAGINGFFNPLPDIPLYYMIEYWNEYPRLIYFIQGLWFGALMFVFYKLVRLYLPFETIRDKILTFICLLIAMTGNALFFQIGTSTNEVMLAFFEMLSLYLLIKEMFFVKSGKWQPYVLSGFILGAAMGLKLTAVIYCVVTGFCLIVCYKQVKNPLRNISLFTFCGLLGFLCFNGFWMIKMWDLFQNPLFPFANKLFNSEWLSNHNFTDDGFLPKNFFEFLIWPIIQSFTLHRDEGGGMFVADMRPLIIYFTLVVCGIIYLVQRIKGKKCSIDVRWRFLLLFFVVTYIIWAVFFSIVRYYVVWEMLAAIFIVRLLYSAVPDTFWKLGFYGSFLVFVTFILISSAIFSDDWGKRYDYKKIPMDKDAYFWMEDKVLIPDNTLFMTFDYPSSALFVKFFQKNNTIRGINMMQGKYIAEQEDGSRIDYFNYHYKWLNKKAEIINSHKGVVFLLAVKGKKTVDGYDFDFTNEEIFKSYDCRPLKNNMVPFAKICVPNKLASVLFKSEKK